VILSPQEYSSAPVRELLDAAARGYVPLDHRLVRALAERGDSALPEFVQFPMEPREDDRFRLREFRLDVARQLHTPAALPFLAEYARALHFEFPDELTEAFAELGAASVDTLLALHKESGGAPDVLFALAGLGVHDPRILRLLLELLESDVADGALALGLCGDPAARPALEKALEQVRDNEWVCQQVQACLEQIDGREPIAPEPFDIRPLYPEEAPPLFDAFDPGELLEFLSSPVAGYRARAIETLTFDEPSAAIARRVFELARTDPDTHVRAQAWECMDGVDDPKEIPQALRDKLEDTAAPIEERAGALVALSRGAGEDEGLHRLILEFYERPETRGRAVQAMWHSGDRRFEGRVAAALGDSDTGVQAQAITATGMFGIVSQIGRIEQFFEDDDLREAALFAYALAAPAEVTPARMRKLFGKIEDLAGGLDEDESEIVGKALDDRLEAFGKPPIFLAEETPEPVKDEAPAPPPTTGRNDPCPCGSGKKYKKCCGR
jgi:SEC-C motif